MKRTSKKQTVLSPVMAKAVQEQQLRVLHLASLIHAVDIASEEATGMARFDVQAALSGVRSLADDIADKLDNVSLEKRATALAGEAEWAEGQS